MGFFCVNNIHFFHPRSKSSAYAILQPAINYIAHCNDMIREKGASAQGGHQQHSWQRHEITSEVQIARTNRRWIVSSQSYPFSPRLCYMCGWPVKVDTTKWPRRRRTWSCHPLWPDCSWQSVDDRCFRDRLTAEKDVLCFGMEAARLVNTFPLEERFDPPATRQEIFSHDPQLPNPLYSNYESAPKH